TCHEPPVAGFPHRYWLWTALAAHLHNIDYGYPSSDYADHWLHASDATLQLHWLPLWRPRERSFPVLAAPVTKPVPGLQQIPANWHDATDTEPFLHYPVWGISTLLQYKPTARQ